MQTKRQANFEILRVLAMIMVVVLHYLSHSDSLLALGVPATSVRITGSLIESFCIVAVNVWVLISGYFLSQSGFKLKRILQIICEIFFYTAAISLNFLLDFFPCKAASYILIVSKLRFVTATIFTLLKL